METQLGNVSSKEFTVEREPMWDDRSGCEWCVVSGKEQTVRKSLVRARSREALLRKYSGMETPVVALTGVEEEVLSENHSGMETHFRFLHEVAAHIVEREPMWDDRSGCEWCVVSSEW